MRMNACIMKNAAEYSLNRVEGIAENNLRRNKIYELAENDSGHGHCLYCI